jgi:hypothetical protein
MDAILKQGRIIWRIAIVALGRHYSLGSGPDLVGVSDRLRALSLMHIIDLKR